MPETPFNGQPESEFQVPGAPRIAPPEGARAARGHFVDETVVDENQNDLAQTFAADVAAPVAPLGFDASEIGVDETSITRIEENDEQIDIYTSAPAPPDALNDKELGLFEHLTELRQRILYCFLIVGMGMAVTWNFRDPLQAWFAKPILGVLQTNSVPIPGMPNMGGNLVSTNPTGFFNIAFQFSLVSALILTMPLVLFQVWRFIEPALTKSEKRYTLILVPFSSILFFMGAALGFATSPIFFKFFIGFQPPGIAAMWDYYDSIILMAKMLLIFGLAFQVPIVVIFLAKVGLVTRNLLIEYWRHAVVVIFILVAVVTPTWDPFTLGVCAVPPCLLYLLSIWLVKWL